MMKHSKSTIQFAYNSYAMALVDSMSYLPVETANNFLIRRKSILEKSFSCSLKLLRIVYDESTTSWKVVPHT